MTIRRFLSRAVLFVLLIPGLIIASPILLLELIVEGTRKLEEWAEL